MRRTVWFGMLLASAMGCQREDADGLERIGQLLRIKIESLKNTGAEAGLSRVFPGLNESVPQLEQHLASRLRADPMLASLAIRLQRKGEKYQLTGRVPGEEERQKVLKAAQDMVGPDAVEDQLRKE